jgi:phosphoglycerol transferase MdoB-like AlkP superfamily enzyme
MTKEVYMAINTNPSVKRWQDQLILLLGLWFFITPWVFAYQIPSIQAWTAFISGAVMVVLAAFDLYKTYFWAVVLNLLVGIWVAVSPWVLGMADNAELTWNAVIVGVAVAVLALWEMRTDPELVKHWPGGAGHAT